MKGIARRSKIMFAFTAAFLAGLIILVSTFVVNAQEWVFKRANLHIYSSGQIVSAGTIYDRNGKVLASTVDGKRTYNESKTIRRATLHAVGGLYSHWSAHRVPLGAHRLQLFKRSI